MRKFKIEPILALSLAAFVASLAFEAFAGERYSRRGYECLLIGWGAMAVNCYAWFANPLLLVAWVLRLTKWRLIAIVFAVLSLLLMLTFLRFDSMLINEAGGTERILRIGLGYWLWIASAGFAIVPALRRPQSS